MPRRQLDTWVWDSGRDGIGDVNLEIISDSYLKPCNWVDSLGNQDRLKTEDWELNIPVYQYSEVRKREKNQQENWEPEAAQVKEAVFWEKNETDIQRKERTEGTLERRRKRSQFLSRRTLIIFPVQRPALNLSLGSPEAEPEKELFIKAVLSGKREWGKSDGKGGKLIKVVLSPRTLKHDAHYELIPSLRKEAALCALESNSHEMQAAEERGDLLSRWAASFGEGN